MAPRLDLSKENETEALENLKKEVINLHGTNFGLLMRQESGLRYYPRSNQPCQGGEMRKYKKTHGDLCTRPTDPRPGDLCHPFPKGIVEAVSIHLQYGASKDRDTFLDALYGPDSIYLKGFNDPDTVLRLRRADGLTYGLVFTDTEVDPSVFVNSLQYLKEVRPSYFVRLLKTGFTPKEALIVSMLIQGTNVKDKIGIGATNSYYFSMYPSLRRLFESDPHDISGGLYRDGYDYNRKDIQDLFKRGEGEPEFNMYDEFKSTFKDLFGKDALTVEKYSYVMNGTPEQFYETVQTIFDKYYRNPINAEKAA